MICKKIKNKLKSNDRKIECLGNDEKWQSLFFKISKSIQPTLCGAENKYKHYLRVRGLETLSGFKSILIPY